MVFCPYLSTFALCGRCEGVPEDSQASFQHPAHIAFPKDWRSSRRSLGATMQKQRSRLPRKGYRL